MASVFIDGEAGTTGLGIRQRLEGLAGIRMLSIDAARRKDPAMRRRLMHEADLVVLCLPDAAARESVALAASLGEAVPKILDASTAHRTDPDWIYGFAELDARHAGRIAAARRVANPGCYATGAIALIRPLRDAGLLPADIALSIHAVSGYSGGGTAMIAAHRAHGGPALALYALGLDHKHVPEIMRWGTVSRRPLFVPAVGHFAQGMIVSIPLFLEELGCSADRLRDALAHHYAGSPVQVIRAEPETPLAAETLAGSDALELRVYDHPDHGHALLVARLDNLGKGASGAAVQNIQLMLGLAR